jgi:hypothetical protein
MECLLIGLATALLTAVAAAADPTAWTVSEIRGEVRAVAGGQSPVALEPRQVLPPGVSVDTGNSGSLTLTHGETTIVVQRNSRIELPGSGAADGRTTIIQSGGRLLYDVEKRSTPHFEVQTPYLAAVVKGTSFAIAVDPSAAQVQVASGAVEIRAMRSGEVSLVRSGLTATVAADPGSRLSITPSAAAPTPDSGPQPGDRAAGGEADPVATDAATGPATPRVKEQGAGVSLPRAIGATSVDIAQASRGFLSGGNGAANPPVFGAASGAGKGGNSNGNGNGKTHDGSGNARAATASAAGAALAQVSRVSTGGGHAYGNADRTVPRGNVSAGGNGKSNGKAKGNGNGGGNANAEGNGNGNAGGNGKSNGKAKGKNT